jgi:hypothetical protein
LGGIASPQRGLERGLANPIRRDGMRSRLETIPFKLGAKPVQLFV